MQCMNSPYHYPFDKVETMAKTRDGQLYTVAEAARVLDVSPSTVWRWIEAHKLPAYRLGPRSIRIRKQDVEAALQPARSQGEVTMERNQALFTPPSPDEIARRKALVAEILEHRAKAVITPLTTADLVHQAREQEYEAYGKPS